MEIHPIPAIKFLKQVCAIENNKEFIDIANSYKYPNIRINVLGVFPRPKASTFFIVNFPRYPKVDRAVYQITHRMLEMEHAASVQILEAYLKKTTLDPEKNVSGPIVADSINAVPGFENYKGIVITLVPPKLSKLNCSDEKLTPAYVRSKMAQLRRAMERIRDNCPHTEYHPYLNHYRCNICDRILHTRELPKK
ncbi:hypothetical protein KJ885_04055 [Patescibacteria group bacterium]|nr:hypothetical protein [Patescibacteria group bacterium]